MINNELEKSTHFIFLCYFFFFSNHDIFNAVLIFLVMWQTFWTLLQTNKKKSNIKRLPWTIPICMSFLHKFSRYIDVQFANVGMRSM